MNRNRIITKTLCALRNLAILGSFLFVFVQQAKSQISIIGDATQAGDWVTDFNMTQDLDSLEVWTTSLYLKKNFEVKFRANNDWGINWGATTFPAGTLEFAGANIMVDSSATYFVTFDSTALSFAFSVIPPDGNVGIGTTNPHTAALLDLNSNSKGLLIPRMLASERVSIVAPVEGLLVYQTDETVGFYFYKSSQWTALSADGSNWSVNGNAGTLDGTHFIGTTDDVPFTIRVNNETAGRIDHVLANTFLGYRAGILTTGINNTAIGTDALLTNTIGVNNTAMGQHALYYNSEGHSNSSFGFQSLESNSTGSSNTGIGVNALLSNSTGNSNTATGQEALISNGIGSGNTANGQGALYNNSEGENNSAFGVGALFNNVTGIFNTAIGSGAGVSSGDLSNSTAIGANAIVTSSNTIQVGDENVTIVNIGMDSTATLVTGGLQLIGGNAEIGKILTSDATGLASWQDAPASVSGVGNITEIAFWGSVDSLSSSSSLFWDNTNLRLGIGTAAPNAELDVTGDALINGLTVGKGSGSIGTNTAFGDLALNSNTTGADNTAYGWNALRVNTIGLYNTATGVNSLANNISGTGNTAVGASSLVNNSTGNSNTALGLNSLKSNDVGNSNTGVGESALISNTTGNNNVAVGYGADVSAGNLTNATAIGANAIVTASNTIQLGNTALTSVIIGIDSTATLVTGGLQLIGGSAGMGKILTSDATGLASWQDAAASVSGVGNITEIAFWGSVDSLSSSSNLFWDNTNLRLGIGTATPNAELDVTGDALINGLTVGKGANNIISNTAIGMQTLDSITTGMGNTAIGTDALSLNTIGNDNTATGVNSLANNISGTGNTAVGASSLVNSTGNGNTALGLNSLKSNDVGNSNTGVGESALISNTTGNNNVAVGNGADVSAGDLTNATAIGSNAIVEASNSIQLGDANVTSVRIGTASTATLVTGGMQLTGGAPGVGKVLTSDASGLASWTAPAGNPVHFVGESYGGGTVFYVYDNGQHGLIAATADQSTGIRWYGGTITITRARADGIKAGLKNTAIIIADQGSVDGNDFAATVCNEYSVTVGGVTYGDWYLPSKYELNLLYLEKNVVGGFSSDLYWSSTEVDNSAAWLQSFLNGGQFSNFGKTNNVSVRAVRAF